MSHRVHSGGKNNPKKRKPKNTGSQKLIEAQFDDKESLKHRNLEIRIFEKIVNPKISKPYNGGILK